LAEQTPKEILARISFDAPNLNAILNQDEDWRELNPLFVCDILGLTGQSGLLESLQSIIKLAPTVKRLLHQTNLAHRRGNRSILSPQNFYLPKLRHNRLGFLAFFQPSLLL